ncbi:hypothetical protein Bca101_023724 [Brassica carinata]
MPESPMLNFSTCGLLSEGVEAQAINKEENIYIYINITVIIHFSPSGSRKINLRSILLSNHREDQGLFDLFRNLGFVSLIRRLERESEDGVLFVAYRRRNELG